MGELSWQALHYGDRIRVINPYGDTGLVTLWTTPELVIARLNELDSSLLNPNSSRVAAVGNLYGDGMYAMFCNLLYNPQITTLLACGQDLGLPTCLEIESFLNSDLERTELYGRPLLRIPGTARFLPFDPNFDQAALRQHLSFSAFGNFASPNTVVALAGALRSLPTRSQESRRRLEVRLPDPEPGLNMPSDISGHWVSRRSPIETWKELVVRTARFGRDVVLAGGPRRELLDVRANVYEPREDSPEVLRKFGFDLAEFQRYQERMLDPNLPSDISYTYGNRLLGHFDQPIGGQDSLATAVESLRGSLESRHAYVTLWDQAQDAGLASPPCLTTLFFRHGPIGLNLTATYRAHNLLTGWLENVYGLMAIQRFVCQALDVNPGSLTVLSHSLSIDPRSSRAELAKIVEAGWKRDDDFDDQTSRYALRSDPNGHFIISVDRTTRTIVAEHWGDGILLRRYASPRAEVIARQIAGHMAISLPSHALWVGQELVRKELELSELEIQSHLPRAVSDDQC